MDKSIKVARELRKNQTDAEKILWNYLRNRQLCGLKFRRQFPVAGYIADFCCAEKKLIIEVDGGQHAIEVDRDQIRAATLRKEGFRILRFWNTDVLQNAEGVLAVVSKVLNTPSPHSSPSRERR